MVITHYTRVSSIYIFIIDKRPTDQRANGSVEAAGSVVFSWLALEAAYRPYYPVIMNSFAALIDSDDEDYVPKPKVEKTVKAEVKDTKKAADKPKAPVNVAFFI
jgi:hypothetical protein